MEIFMYTGEQTTYSLITSKLLVKTEHCDEDCYIHHFNNTLDVSDAGTSWRAFDPIVPLANYFINPLQPTKNELDMFEMLFDTKTKNDLLELLEEIK